MCEVNSDIRRCNGIIRYLIVDIACYGCREGYGCQFGRDKEGNSPCDEPTKFIGCSKCHFEIESESESESKLEIGNKCDIIFNEVIYTNKISYNTNKRCHIL